MSKSRRWAVLAFLVYHPSGMDLERERIDIWLWRARLFKTRSIAARFVEGGAIRLTRGGEEARIDKCSRPVKADDQLVFVVGGRVFAITIVALGDRRGTASEARSLYRFLDANLGQHQ